MSRQTRRAVGWLRVKETAVAVLVKERNKLGRKHTGGIWEQYIERESERRSAAEQKKGVVYARKHSEAVMDETGLRGCFHSLCLWHPLDPSAGIVGPAARGRNAACRAGGASRRRVPRQLQAAQGIVWHTAGAGSASMRRALN